jgi:putative transposase
MKPNVTTQIYIELVFAVKYREATLNHKFHSRIFEYMSGTLKSMNHKSIIVNGVSNHVHVFYGMNSNLSVSETVHDLKRSSSMFINQNGLCKLLFGWQKGYGAFSYSKSQIQAKYDYISNQEIHHKKWSFQEEYLKLLKEFEIDYQEKYLFDFLE